MPMANVKSGRGCPVRRDPRFRFRRTEPGNRQTMAVNRGGAEADALDLQVPEAIPILINREEEQHTLAQDLEDLLNDENSVV